MRLLIEGRIFDSTETPVLIVFDENEQELFNGMKRFVSAPKDYTEEERESLISSIV